MSEKSALSSQELDALMAETEGELPRLPEVEFPETRSSESDSRQQARRRAFYREQLAALGDMELEVRIEIGKTSLTLQQVAMLRRGSVVVLDRNIDEPVNVLVNGKVIARGELLVVDGKFSVRIVEFV